METKIAITNEDNIKECIKEAAEVIKNGGVVAFPTETVYGLGANALKEECVKKIFVAKGRPQDNPLIVHVASKNIDEYVKNIPDVANKLIDKFWPGPLTLILEKRNIIPMETSANLDTIGIRMPSNKIAMELIKESGVPIAAPSANISGRPSPTNIERCVEDLKGRVDYILGGEISEVGLESTIVDCTVYPPMVLRPGGITLEMLREVDENIEIDKGLLNNSKEFKPKAPGMKYRHYAPNAKLKIIRGNNKKTIEKINEMVQNYIDKEKSVGILTTKENSSKYPKGKVVILGEENNLEEIASNLFNALREFNDLGVDIILAEAFNEEGIGVAIMNRLNKAAGYDIIDV
ncbi:MAG: threonylcarbamoyl-AMP synthase [Clostridium baratii]|uniref:Threonylcarbamoyl-AMP synthase n=1 Tax=Clostridium baratii str. Sullivan TaxID=1415775 RepID=A0A0A7G0R6_9CLOT|nr:L-threonylcarbamoyladenylate synthase [Clostridium baratii]AIY84676.1 tRNA threonylcarbamoyl adenosine modification protein, Sua5/YciO/YrdC/YwlC family [Clostridium baratii str. Sullivan]MBS6005379.1 threonylcarbamoyl-AMP synthase [Clostridium baratii]MDU1052444.1 L-threonylcarbamoyladenylate synthase [Clostridium baratii]MDU4909934.1 L-threonylcarbamoyladenylate synthase [Clostridium baratii]CUP37651.1 Sua5/YciO/YrdC/YwlC family protein [Clostridium baratii]